MHNYTNSKPKSSALDVEIGPVTIKQTKTGPGAKSRAYLCSMVAVKILLAMALITAIVVGYQFIEIRVINTEVESEITMSHKIEKVAHDKIIKVSNVLEQFLLREAKEKNTAREYRSFLNEQFDRFFHELSSKDLDEKLLQDWNEFRDNIMTQMTGLLDSIEEEARDAKSTLISLNRMLSDDSFYPSRERVSRKRRGLPTEGSRSHRERIAHEKLGPDFGKGKKGRFSGNDETPELLVEKEKRRRHMDSILKRTGKSSVQDSVKHFFRRFDAIDTLKISEETLKKMQDVTSDDANDRTKIQSQAEQIRKILIDDDSVDGIDLDELLHSGSDFSVVRGAKEILGANLVKSHKDDLEKLKTLWTMKELDDNEIFQKLQELASLQDIPFEWFVGDHARRNDVVGVLGEEVLMHTNNMEEDENYEIPKDAIKRIVNMVRSFERDNVVHIRPFSWWTAVARIEESDKEMIVNGLKEISKRSEMLKRELNKWEARKDRKGGPNSRKGRRKRRRGRGFFGVK
jgi:hypothetical protein